MPLSAVYSQLCHTLICCVAVLYIIGLFPQLVCVGLTVDRHPDRQTDGSPGEADIVSKVAARQTQRPRGPGTNGKGEI